MSLKLVSNGTIGNKLVLALVVVWCLTGDKPVELVMIMGWCRKYGKPLGGKPLGGKPLELVRGLVPGAAWFVVVRPY